MTKSIAIIIAWVCVFTVGIFLRFDALSKRPFHADEATGARITATRLEADHYAFDPHHFHGPLLSGLAIPLCTFKNQNHWQTLEKSTLRLLPAIAGSLLLLLPLLGRKRFSDGPMLLASACLAISPLLVYYSRMFIHEPLLVLFGVMTLFAIVRFPRFGLPGLLLGLMAATKETFVISLISWIGAFGFVVVRKYRYLSGQWLIVFWREHRLSLVFSAIVAVISSLLLYTDFLRQPHAAIDAVRTFFVYKTTVGHAKAWWYYLELLAIPVKSGGVWWFGTPVVLLALIAWVYRLRKTNQAREIIDFLAYSTIFQLLIYSVISYKTPWLACLPWAQLCLLAGFSVYEFSKMPQMIRLSTAALIVICLFTQVVQAYFATGRFDSDERNPFAYVPTRPDIENLEPWLLKLREIAPQVMAEPIAIIGAEYWPLPWYLRAFDKKGYWPIPPNDLKSRALVFAMPEQTTAVTNQLENSHVALARGLRAGVPVTLFMRNDLWQLWMKDSER